jgi:hypothetical protein
MHDIIITQWRGNKDVPLLSIAMPSIPRIEDHLEFHTGGKLVKGKVTRVSYRIAEHPNQLPRIETQVRVNVK